MYRFWFISELEIGSVFLDQIRKYYSRSRFPKWTLYAFSWKCVALRSRKNHRQVKVRTAKIKPLLAIFVLLDLTFVNSPLKRPNLAIWGPHFEKWHGFSVREGSKFHYFKFKCLPIGWRQWFYISLSHSLLKSERDVYEQMNEDANFSLDCSFVRRKKKILRTIERPCTAILNFDIQHCWSAVSILRQYQNNNVENIQSLHKIWTTYKAVQQQRFTDCLSKL